MVLLSFAKAEVKNPLPCADENCVTCETTQIPEPAISKCTRCASGFVYSKSEQMCVHCAKGTDAQQTKCLECSAECAICDERGYCADCLWDQAIDGKCSLPQCKLGIYSPLERKCVAVPTTTTTIPSTNPIESPLPRTSIPLVPTPISSPTPCKAGDSKCNFSSPTPIPPVRGAVVPSVTSSSVCKVGDENCAWDRKVPAKASPRTSK